MRMRVSNIFLSLVAVRCSGLAAGPHDQEGLEKVDYTGHKIVKIFDLDANTIHRLDEAGFDRWALDEKEKAVVYRFTPEQFTNLPEVLERPVAFEVVNDNVQDLIDAEMMDLAQKSSRAVSTCSEGTAFSQI